MSVVPGPDFGPYRVLRQLGVGGMGTVLLAEDTRLGRYVALKTITGPEAQTPHGRHQLMREARAAAALNHPNIAAVHDVLDLNGQVAIVFEYVEGETLAARIAQGPLPPKQAVDIAIQLADALSIAHAHGIVHRDLKPANVILDDAGRAKILDFGIARIPPRDATAPLTVGTVAGGLLGTPGYAAPEQWVSQEVDARSDIYALGVVLFEMLAGERPFGRSGVMTIAEEMLQKDPPHIRTRVPTVPGELDALVSAAMARDPDARPQTARQVKTTLRRIEEQLDIQKPRPWFVTRIAAAAVIVSALLAGLVVWRVWRPPVAATSSRAPVVAVLPSSELGSDPKSYLASGIAESLITRLASLPSVTVLSRDAVADARKRSPDRQSLTRELAAAYLVETSVQQEGDRLRVTLNLVRSDGSVEWGESFEGAFNRIFDLQTRLASALTKALDARLTPADRKKLAEEPTSSPDALAAYWQGKALLERRDVAGNLEAAVRAFENSIRHDPKFADAYAGLGEAFWARWIDTRDEQWAEQARTAGLRASQLDPDRPNVLYSLALTLIGSGRVDDGILELQRVLTLSPNHVDARLQLGRTLVRLGRTDEAISEFRKTTELRPDHPGSYHEMGLGLYEAGRFKEAVEAFERVVQLQPDNALAYQRLGTAYQVLGDDARALASYERVLSLPASSQAYAQASSNIGAFYHSRGEYAKAVEAYQKAIKYRPNSAITHRNLGDAYQRMNRSAEARASYLEAVRLAEAELRVNPHDARNLASLAVYLQKAGNPVRAEVRLGEAMRLAPTDFDVLRRAAIVYALARRVETALEMLGGAIQHGYPPSVARKEEDFEVLRSHPRFKRLVDEPQT